MGGGFALNIYLSINVAMARKKYDVQYPALYAPNGHKYEKEFNSVQRAHQNTLESFSFVFLQTALCGNNIFLTYDNLFISHFYFLLFDCININYYNNGY